VPVAGLRLKLIPTDAELDLCRDFGAQIAAQLRGETKVGGVIEFEDL
jgi:hypothetical protein